MNASTAHRPTAPHLPGFPVRGFLAALAAFVSGHWLATHIYEKLVEHMSASRLWIVFGLSLAATVGVAWWSFHRHHEHPRTSSRTESLFVFGLGALVLFFAVWTGLALEHLLKDGALHMAKTPWIFSGLCLIALIASSHWLERAKSGYDHVRDVEPPLATQAARLRPGAPEIGAGVSDHFHGLVMIVSTPSQVPGVAGQNDPKEARAGVAPAPSGPPPPATDTGLPIAEGASCWLRDNKGKWRWLAGESLRADLDALDALQGQRALRWNWTPLLRAIRPHCALKRVVLLGSKNTSDYRPLAADAQGRQPELEPGYSVPPEAGKGSVDYLSRCQAFLHPYLRLPDGGVSVWPDAVNFEDFNELTATLQKILRTEFPGIRKDRVVLDLTGGQKVASIAAAALTLNNELRFQYVQTGKPFATVPYDLVKEELPGPHPHFPHQKAADLPGAH